MKIVTTSFSTAELLREETLFHTANGYLGVRGCFEEGYPNDTKTIRGCYINAFYDIVDIKYPEKLFGFPESAQRLINLPDMQTTRLYLDGAEASLFACEISDYRRELNMKEGISLRTFRVKSENGKTALVSFKRMTSFVRRELFFTEITVETDEPCELKIVSEMNCDVYNFFDSHDPRVASERTKYLNMESAEICGEVCVSLSETSKSGLYVAAAMSHTVSPVSVPPVIQLIETPDGFRTEITCLLDKNAVTIGKYCAYSDSRRYGDCKARAVAVVNEAVSSGGGVLFAEQAAYLAEFWGNCGVQIRGNGNTAEHINESMAFNLYGLLQSAGRDAVSNIAAKGLSGEGYEGHYFWDTEIYILPFFLLTMPERAKTLLEYRHSILDGARAHAKILGHEKGALYPWRTITGSECSTYYPSGSAQYHINADIAHAFTQYYYATGDINFMAEKGAEVLLETARFWANAGTYDRAGRLCYNCVTGPDEYTCIVNNNYFTNVSARQNLLSAIYICEELKNAGKFEALMKLTNVSDAELEGFKKAANDIYLPYDSELDINPQDDSFLDKARWDLKSIPAENFPILMHYHPLKLYSSQVCKQADVVLAHYLYGGKSSAVKNSYDYYENVTTHDSSLSRCTFGIMASQLGMDEKAYRYFLDVARTDLDDIQHNTKDGVHTANMGGAYLAVAAGFAGLRIDKDCLRFNFSLPKEWTGYEFNLCYKGSRFSVSVMKNEAEFRLKDGCAPVTVFVGEKEVRISGTQAVSW